MPAGLIALALSRTLPRGAWWGKAALLGVLNIGVFFPLLFVAAERLPGASLRPPDHSQRRSMATT